MFYDFPKRRWTSTEMHGVTTEKLVTLIVAAMETSNPTKQIEQLLCFWHHPSALFNLKYSVSETLFYIQLQVEPTHLHPIDRASLSSEMNSRFIDWTQLTTPENCHLLTAVGHNNLTPAVI
jgi:uncharacterized protein (DUF2132 family)